MAQVLWFIFASIVVPLVFKVFAAIGIGSVTYIGVQALLDQVSTLIQSYLFALPVEIQQLLGVLRLDDAISLVLSAAAVRAVFAGLNSSGVISKTQWKLPTGSA